MKQKLVVEENGTADERANKESTWMVGSAPKPEGQQVTHRREDVNRM